MEIKLIEDGDIVNGIHLMVSPEEYLIISSALKQFEENPNNVLVDIMTAKQMRIDICNRAESEAKDGNDKSNRNGMESN